MRGVRILILLMLAGSARAAPPAPSVRLQADGSATVAMNARLLEDPEVRKHVMSGLTMNLLLTLGEEDHHGRIAIRYEPWDEIFIVSALGADGSIEKKTLRSFEALKEWWAAPRLPIARRHAAGGTIRISVSVIPFSASEEADVKRWLARSLPGGAEGGAGQVGSSGQVSRGAPSLFSAVIGSSIRRKPVLRYVWNVRVVEPGR